MLHQAEFEKQVTELYTLMGHQVERVIKRGVSISDLIIKSKNGERWITRCEGSEVNDTVVRDFFQVLQSERGKQAAIITRRKVTSEARELVKGKPIHLLDGRQFQDYLRQARNLVTQAPINKTTPRRRAKRGKVATATGRISRFLLGFIGGPVLNWLAAELMVIWVGCNNNHCGFGEGMFLIFAIPVVVLLMNIVILIFLAVIKRWWIAAGMGVGSAVSIGALLAWWVSRYGWHL